MKSRAVLGLSLLLLTACDCGGSGPTGSGGGGDGGGGNVSGDGGSDAASNGSGDGGGADAGSGNGDAGSGVNDAGLLLPSCAERANYIYVVDNGDVLYRFDPHPATMGFTQIGTGPLNCGATGSHPFSMAVDHDAVAWVLFDNHKVYQVSTVDGACTGGTAATPATWTTYGMGFSSNMPYPNSLAETLFLGGGTNGSPAKLATMNLTTFAVTEIGNLSGNPELTGNGNAELWGFLPDTNPSSIKQIDKTNATAIATYALNQNNPDSLTVTTGSGSRRWAFAFWGGDYYVFYKAAQEASTNVYRFRPPRNGNAESFTRIITNSGKQIVGAGVSTCAQVVPPIDIQ
ncbi:MAG: hypothetical protein U0230_12640 [Polyangiales bacterium]